MRPTAAFYGGVGDTRGAQEDNDESASDDSTSDTDDSESESDGSESVAIMVQAIARKRPGSRGAHVLGCC
jgi:hypothetical protein